MPMQTVGIVVLVVAAALLVYVEVQKRTTFAKLEAYLKEGDFENYLKVLDRPVTAMLYPRYNRLFMRLNAMLGMDDTEQIGRIIDEMKTLKMSEDQRLALAVKAFNFYVEVEDEPHAAEELAVIERGADKAVAMASRRTYDIFLGGSSAYIDDMEAMLEHAERGEKALLCQLLAVQYENRGDTERSAAYVERAAKLLGI